MGVVESISYDVTPVVNLCGAVSAYRMLTGSLSVHHGALSVYSCVTVTCFDFLTELVMRFIAQDANQQM